MVPWGTREKLATEGWGLIGESARGTLRNMARAKQGV